MLRRTVKACLEASQKIHVQVCRMPGPPALLQQKKSGRALPWSEESGSFVGPVSSGGSFHGPNTADLLMTI